MTRRTLWYLACAVDALIWLAVFLMAPQIIRSIVAEFSNWSFR